jgi:hypothetical protein
MSGIPHFVAQSLRYHVRVGSAEHDDEGERDFDADGKFDESP